MLREYKHRCDEKMVQALEEAPVTMEDGAPQGYRRLRDKAMHAVGIGTMHDMDSVITGIFLPSLRFPEYTVSEKIALWRGRAFSKSTDLFDIALRTNLADVVSELQVPVYFLHGAYDYTCNYDLAREYFRSLKAPMKGFYTFEESAHSPVFEEPDKASQILDQDGLAGTTTLADSHRGSTAWGGRVKQLCKRLWDIHRSAHPDEPGHKGPDSPGEDRPCYNTDAQAVLAFGHGRQPEWQHVPRRVPHGQHEHRQRHGRRGFKRPTFAQVAVCRPDTDETIQCGGNGSGNCLHLTRRRVLPSTP